MGLETIARRFAFSECSEFKLQFVSAVRGQRKHAEGRISKLVCKADFASYFRLKGRSSIRRPAIDVKHARRPGETSRAGVWVDPIDRAEQSGRNVEDTDIVSF